MKLAEKFPRNSARVWDAIAVRYGLRSRKVGQTLNRARCMRRGTSAPSLYFPFFLKEEAPSNPSNPSISQQRSAFVEARRADHCRPTRPIEILENCSKSGFSGINSNILRGNAKISEFHATPLGMAPTFTFAQRSDELEQQGISRHRAVALRRGTGSVETILDALRELSSDKKISAASRLHIAYRRKLDCG